MMPSTQVRLITLGQTNRYPARRPCIQQQMQAQAVLCCDAGIVRRDGSYIYEEFLATGGTDVKVSSACVLATGA